MITSAVHQAKPIISPFNIFKRFKMKLLARMPVTAARAKMPGAKIIYLISFIAISEKERLSIVQARQMRRMFNGRDISTAMGVNRLSFRNFAGEDIAVATDTLDITAESRAANINSRLPVLINSAAIFHWISRNKKIAVDPNTPIRGERTTSQISR